MSSRTVRFPKEKIVTTQELIDALSKFPPQTEILIAVNNDKRVLKPRGVSDNADWGKDNDVAFIEVRL